MKEWNITYILNGDFEYPKEYTGIIAETPNSAIIEFHKIFGSNRITIINIYEI